MSGELLTVQAVAARLGGASVSMVYNMIHRGELPIVRVGRLVRVPSAELEAFIQRGGSVKEKPAPESTSEPAAAKRPAKTKSPKTSTTAVHETTAGGLTVLGRSPGGLRIIRNPAHPPITLD